jgi:hypothetical protein
MKRITLIGSITMTLLGCGALQAQTTATKADDHTAHHAKASPAETTPKGADATKDGATGAAMMNKCVMGEGMMGGGMMGAGDRGMGSGGGMKGGCGMMALCPGMLGNAAKFEVTKQAKGVTISITSDDPKVVARMQKMAEGMRHKHEAKAR